MGEAARDLEDVIDGSPEVYVAVPPCNEDGIGIPGRVGDAPGVMSCCIFKLDNQGTLEAPDYRIVPVLNPDGSPVRRDVYNIYPEYVPTNRPYVRIEREKYGRWLAAERFLVVGTATTTTAGPATTTTTPEPCEGRCWWIAQDGLWHPHPEHETTCELVTTTTTSTTTTEAPDGGVDCLCPTTTTTTSEPTTTSTTTTSDPIETENPCRCIEPRFCPTEDGQCTWTICSQGYVDPNVDCIATTTTTTGAPTGSCCYFDSGVEDFVCDDNLTEYQCLNETMGSDPVWTEGYSCEDAGCPDPTTTTSTSTTFDCNTTTTMWDCSLGCDWVWIPWGGGGWHKVADYCPDVIPAYCSCSPPAAPPEGGDECPTAHTPCVIPTPGSSSSSCSGNCTWYWIGPLQSFYHVSSYCYGINVPACWCATPLPPDDPEFCGPVVEPCRSPTTTTTQAPNPCYTTTTETTSEPTTTTTQCPGRCIWKWDELEEEWIKETDTCPEGCSCVRPVYTGTYDCEVLETHCFAGTTTTTTTDEPTTTTTTTGAPCDECPPAETQDIDCGNDCLSLAVATCDGGYMPECLKLLIRSNDPVFGFPDECSDSCRCPSAGPGIPGEAICEEACLCWTTAANPNLPFAIPRYQGTVSWCGNDYEVNFYGDVSGTPSEWTDFIGWSVFDSMGNEVAGGSVVSSGDPLPCDAESITSGNFEMLDAELCYGSDLLPFRLNRITTCGGDPTTTTTTVPVGACCATAEGFTSCFDDLTAAECAGYMGSVWHEGLTCLFVGCETDPSTTTTTTDSPVTTTTTGEPEMGSCCFCEGDPECVYDCHDNVTETECVEMHSPGGTFYSGGNCADLIAFGSCPVVTTSTTTSTTPAPLGSCCDLDGGNCYDNMTQAACQDLSLPTYSWNFDTPCSSNPCGFGYCCGDDGTVCFDDYTYSSCCGPGGVNCPGSWTFGLGGTCAGASCGSVTTTTTGSPAMGACCDPGPGICYDSLTYEQCMDAGLPEPVFHNGLWCWQIECY